MSSVTEFEPQVDDDGTTQVKLSVASLVILNSLISSEGGRQILLSSGLQSSPLTTPSPSSSCPGSKFVLKSASFNAFD